MEKTSKITKPKTVKSTVYFSELPPDFPSSSQGSCALWSCLEGGIAPGVPQPWSTFTASDRCHGQSEPSARWHRPSCCCGKAPSLGRKRKSALNPCISKEVSGKNTSPARMLSSFFFFFNKSYLYIQSSELVTTGSRPFGAQEPHRSLSCLQKALVEHCFGL